MSICETCVPGAQRGQKKTTDPLQLELQMLVDHSVGAEDQTQVLCRSSSLQLEKNPFISLLFHQ